MQTLRSYIRSVLVEISQLPKEWFTEIDRAVNDSSFWVESNSSEDTELGPKGSLQTPAALKLETALQNVFDELGMSMDAFVSSHETDDPSMMLHPDHPAYPDRWLIDARWYVSKQNPGRNTVDLELMTFDEDADASEVNSSALVRHITQSVRHELVHYTQMKKQSLKKGLNNDTEAFDEMVNDKSQIPDENDPKYWEGYEPTGAIDPDTKKEIINKEGFKSDLHTQDYLKSHIEIDAHAHDAAEELLAVYDYEGAQEGLRSGFDLSDPKLPNAIQHYYDYLPADDPTIKKFLKKLNSYIDYMKE